MSLLSILEAWSAVTQGLGGVACADKARANDRSTSRSWGRKGMTNSFRELPGC